MKISMADFAVTARMPQNVAAASSMAGALRRSFSITVFSKFSVMQELVGVAFLVRS